MTAVVDTSRHGRSAYNDGCRCRTCRDANAAHTRDHYARPVDPDRHGTRTNYSRGCHCDPCRAAAGEENRKRASRARRHRNADAWRAGDRSPAARAEHAAAERIRRTRRADGRFDDKTKRRILSLVKRGFPLADAAASVGVTRQAVAGYAGRHPAFADALDDAYRRAAPAGTRHGTDYGYRAHGCRCRPCRAAHHGNRGVS